LRWRRATSSARPWRPTTERQAPVSALWRCHYQQAPGTPDLAWPGRRVAVFVDGAFWHGHPSRYKPGRSGYYWDAKIERNVARDRRVDAELKERGWRIIRVWDFEVGKELVEVVQRVLAVLEEAGQR
jgi:DNA mismatch endonuclease (patch repair protein)